MKNKSAFINIIPLLVIGVIIAGAGLFWFNQQNNPEVLTSPTPISTYINDNWKIHTIEEINLTYKTPEEMEVSFESQKDEQTGIAYSHTLYVQKGNGGTPEYYQLYGLYQVGEAYTGSLEFFKEELDNAKEITVSGLPAISGQVKGQRNRFVTHISMPDGRFSLFTAEPTEENKILTEKILSTFEFSDKNTSYVCPSSEWINCMPGPQAIPKECGRDYLSWAEENCEDFMGAAY